jgi:hypothetical protein
MVVDNTPGKSFDIVAIGDFNGGGQDDILFHDDGAWAARSWDGRMDLGLLPVTPNSWDIEAAGDFNADGRDDLLIRDQGVVSAWLATPNGVQHSGIYGSPDLAWQIQNDPTGIV